MSLSGVSSSGLSFVSLEIVLFAIVLGIDAMKFLISLISCWYFPISSVSYPHYPLIALVISVFPQPDFYSIDSHDQCLSTIITFITYFTFSVY